MNSVLDVLTHPGMWPIWIAGAGLAIYGAWEWFTDRAP